MSLREELKASIQVAEWMKHDSGDTTCGVFLRDHGQALLDAMEDAERYRWLRDASDCEIEVYIPTDKNPSGFGAWHSHKDKDAAIDAAIKGDGEIL
jgi:hypothetical protein